MWKVIATYFLKRRTPVASEFVRPDPAVRSISELLCLTVAGKLPGRVCKTTFNIRIYPRRASRRRLRPEGQIRCNRGLCSNYLFIESISTIFPHSEHVNFFSILSLLYNSNSSPQKGHFMKSGKVSETSLLQYLQNIAPAVIVSPQYGHINFSPEAIISASSFL